MRTVDWIIVAVVVLCALGGLRRGLVATVLGLGGLVLGGYLGSRLGPALFRHGSASPYTPVAALGGAVAGAIVFQLVGATIGALFRNSTRLAPPLRALDSIGGLVAGALWGLVLVWVLGAVALQLPGQTQLRRDAQRSLVLKRLDAIAAPGAVLRALARIDPLPEITGPAPPSLPPDTRVLAEPAVRSATPSVLRITASACGLDVEGSGWVARPHLVVTAAHVVAGASGIAVGGDPASVWAFDPADDVAVLDVPRLDAPPLRYGAPIDGETVAILGYPENGPFDARPGRTGASATVLVNGTPRIVTALGGLIRHGNSGGPAVDGDGVVRSTIFAARIGAPGGYGIPSTTVARVLAGATGPVSDGGC